MTSSERDRIVIFPTRASEGAKRPDETDRHVGMRIRLQRTLIGMSQDKLAELLGITFQQVQKYEKGMNRVGAGRLMAIAKALGAPIGFFYEGQMQSDDTESDVAEVYSLLATPHAVELIQAFARIKSKATRQAIVTITQAATKDS